MQVIKVKTYNFGIDRNESYSFNHLDGLLKEYMEDYVELYDLLCDKSMGDTSFCKEVAELLMYSHIRMSVQNDNKTIVLILDGATQTTIKLTDSQKNELLLIRNSLGEAKPNLDVSLLSNLLESFILPELSNLCFTHFRKFEKELLFKKEYLILDEAKHAIISEMSKVKNRFRDNITNLKEGDGVMFNFNEDETGWNSKNYSEPKGVFIDRLIPKITSDKIPYIEYKFLKMKKDKTASKNNEGIYSATNMNSTINKI